MKSNSTGHKIQSFQRKVFSKFTRRLHPAKSDKAVLVQETWDQKQSILFTLPFELREIIWRFALGGRIIHLQNIDGRLGKVKCIEPTGEIWDLGDHHCWYRGCTNIGARLSYERCPAYSGRYLGLLMTCHRIHDEAAHLLCTSNTVSIRNIRLISQMQTGPFASHASLITSLHLSWTISWPTAWIVYPPVYGSSSTSQPHQQPTWLNAWQLLASFKGLKVLRMEFRNYYPDGEADRRIMLLNELCCIRQTNLFEVRVPWDLKDSGILIQDPPFTLMGSDGKIYELSKNWKKN